MPMEAENSQKINFFSSQFILEWSSNLSTEYTANITRLQITVQHKYPNHPKNQPETYPERRRRAVNRDFRR